MQAPWQAKVPPGIPAGLLSRPPTVWTPVSPVLQQGVPEPTTLPPWATPVQNEQAVNYAQQQTYFQQQAPVMQGCVGGVGVQAVPTSTASAPNGFVKDQTGFHWQDIRGQWHSFRYATHIEYLNLYNVCYCVYFWVL